MIFFILSIFLLIVLSTYFKEESFEVIKIDEQKSAEKTDSKSFQTILTDYIESESETISWEVKNNK